MIKDLKLPDCMMPDGGHSCPAYLDIYELARKYEQALNDIRRHQKIVGGGFHANTGAWQIANKALNTK